MANYTLLILGLIVVIGLLFFLVPQRESFTTEQQEFAQKLTLQFQNEEIPTFTKFLLILTELENTSDNLISKGVYNKFSEKGKKLKEADILQEM